MKRGIVLNLVLFFILALLVALPFLIMLLAGSTAEALGCDMGGGSMPDGFCGTLYTIVFVVGWSSIAIVPLTVGLLLLYLFGVSLFFTFSLVRAGLKSEKVSPLASGMMASTLAILLLSGGVIIAVGGINWFQVDFVNRCEGLPGPLAATGKQNGPLALAVKVPAASELESRTILAVTPDGQLVFRLDKSHWGRSPAWSPDGAQLAFVSQDFQTRNFSLRLADLQGQAGPSLLEEAIKLESLSWLPDGKSILFTGLTEAGGDTELFFVGLDGSAPRRLTFSDGFDGDARISPDGKQIVFASNRDGNDDIYLMDIDGSNVRRLTNNPASDVHPSWSPDGRWIVFASTRGSGTAMNTHDIYIMAADGSNQCQLTQGQTPEWRPVWSPDGQWIAYAALYERQVYLVRPDGTGNQPFQLPLEVEDIYELDWSIGQ